MKKDLWNKCDICGRIISFQDFADDKAKHILLEPSSDLGVERYETYHNICEQKESHE